MHPVAGGRDFKTKRIHMATYELGRAGHCEARFEATHVRSDEAWQNALNSHAKMLGLQRQIPSEFFNESLIMQ